MIFGAQYYRPPFPGRADWVRDFDNMVALGFNTVKLWAVWNWVEPRRGEHDFADLDELVALARGRGLTVVINTIPEGAPPWSLEGNRDALYTTKSGERVVYGGPANLPSAGWPGLCPDKAGAADLMLGFIEAVAAHYADEAAVTAIDVWNEPHLEPMFDYRSDMLCYCEHSAAEFRLWLARKYGSIGALNEAWFRRLSSWEEVDPPPRFGTWADMMDWRLFWMDNLGRWLRQRVGAARRGAPGKLIQTHVAYSATLGNKLAGGLANEVGDEFTLAREVDVFGLSSFPKWLQGERHVMVQLAHNEIVAEASRGKDFYQVELQGGGGKAGLLGGEVPDARDITLWNFNTIAAGGKGVLYWQYAPEPAGVESPGFGLTGFRGENTERSQAASACAKRLTLPALDRARRILSSNAIYLSRHSETLCFCAERRDDLYATSVAGAYKAAYLESIPVRFVHEDYVELMAAEGVKVLYMPMTLVVSDRERRALLSFVEEGGTLVAEAGVGLYDAGGKLDQECLTLEEIFGLEHIELQALPQWGFVRTAGSDRIPSFSGKQYRQLVKPKAGVETLAL
ncbi:MAG: alpha-amylase family protein, partial [Spirochaetota bacterium]